MLYIWKKKPPSEWLFFFTCTGGVFLLFFALQAALGTDRVPRFKVQIPQIGVGQTEPTVVAGVKIAPGQKMPFVSLVAVVSNTGAPSIATLFKLTVTFRDGTVKRGQLMNFDDGTPLLREGGFTEIVHDDEFLPTRTAQPIPKGGAVVGKLFYKIPDVSSKSDLTAIGTIYRLEVQDLWQRTYTCEHPYSVRTNLIYNFPGLRPQSFSTTQQATPSMTPTPP